LGTKRFHKRLAAGDERQEADRLTNDFDDNRPHPAVRCGAGCNEFGLTLLYDEARQNFLKGFYPCKEKDTVHLAAISTRILYGNTTKMRAGRATEAVRPAGLRPKPSPHDNPRRGWEGIMVNGDGDEDDGQVVEVKSEKVKKWPFAHLFSPLSEKPELSCILPAHMLLVNERANELWKKISKALKRPKNAFEALRGFSRDEELCQACEKLENANYTKKYSYEINLPTLFGFVTPELGSGCEAEVTLNQYSSSGRRPLTAARAGQAVKPRGKRCQFVTNLHIQKSGVHMGYPEDKKAVGSQPHVSHLRAHCGVNDYGLHLISASTMVLMASYGHRELSWSFEVGKPFLEVHARTHGHQMTIRTPQAWERQKQLEKLLVQGPFPATGVSIVHNRMKRTGSEGNPTEISTAQVNLAKW
uniref:FERM_M domain-containing protein n=1 Tax=Heligmosomoides polygyrus TaxID=6339 RepID=A0A8L8K034_HELPZ